MALTQENTQNNTKTQRTTRRNRHSEKKSLFLCFSDLHVYVVEFWVVNTRCVFTPHRFLSTFWDRCCHCVLYLIMPFWRMRSKALHIINTIWRYPIVCQIYVICYNFSYLLPIIMLSWTKFTHVWLWS